MCIRIGVDEPVTLVAIQNAVVVIVNVIYVPNPVTVAIDACGIQRIIKRLTISLCGKSNHLRRP